MNIIKNKKAFHDYFIEDQYEAGIVLQGWEIKAVREGRVQIRDSYVIYQNDAFWIIGCHISPLLSASTHVNPDQTRTRKLLLTQKEIDKLHGKLDKSGYTIVALDMHYTRGWLKVQIALAKGKQQHDKRQSEKDKEWKREKELLFKHKMR
jgi:SsrA-binding protein